MTPAQAFERVVFEGTNIDGMVVQVRTGCDPDPLRVEELLHALIVVEQNIRGETTLDRKLAAALNGLTFHMSASLDHWEFCAWMDGYVQILAVIESIFDGVPYEVEE